MRDRLFSEDQRELMLARWELCWIASGCPEGAPCARIVVLFRVAI